MDDILFRHTAVATPNEKSDEFLERTEASENAQKLVKEAKEFDLMLSDCLDIDVPEDLTDKIFLEQSFAVEQEKKFNSRWHIAIAASIAFVLGISIPMLNNYNSAVPDIGTVALQLVQDEYYFTANANENATIQNVNAKLARYGATATEDLGEIYFVNYCDFKGTPALHMIMQGEMGRVTVFMMPEEAEFKHSAKFSNEHLAGLAEQVGKVKMVIVGEREEPLEHTKEKLDKTIKWDI